MQNPNNLEGKADLSLIYNVNARLVHMKSRHITIPCKMIGREAPASARACARHQIVEIAASEVNTHVFDLVVALFVVLLD
jgi:hypothetical protein